MDKSLFISRQLRCPVCDGQTLDASAAPMALEMKAMIQGLLRQGKTEHEILEQMAKVYGQEILVNPPLETHPILWGAPLGIMVIAGMILYSKIRRQK